MQKKITRLHNVSDSCQFSSASDSRLISQGSGNLMLASIFNIGSINTSAKWVRACIRARVCVCEQRTNLPIRASRSCIRCDKLKPMGIHVRTSYIRPTKEGTKKSIVFVQSSGCVVFWRHTYTHAPRYRFEPNISSRCRTEIPDPHSHSKVACTRATSVLSKIRADHRHCKLQLCICIHTATRCR